VSSLILNRRLLSIVVVVVVVVVVVAKIEALLGNVFPRDKYPVKLRWMK
jgi:hypothetical protein